MSNSHEIFTDLINRTNEYIQNHIPASARDNMIGKTEDGKVHLQAQSVVTKQPELIKNCSMRDYQIDGLNWMIRLFENGISGILADEMGLGKTLQTISLLAHLKEKHNITGPHIVLVPLSTLGNWCNEIARFCPSMKVCRFYGTHEERELLVREVIKPLDFDIMVTSFETASRERFVLRRIQWKFLIVDEAHRLKNENSQLSLHAREFKATNRLLVTGTPLQNNLHELWALLNFLLPKIFDSSDNFDAMFSQVERTAGVDERGEKEEEEEEVEGEVDADEAEFKSQMLNKLHDVLRPFMLRRLKSDVNTGLPPKKELMVNVGMSPRQKEIYRGILTKNLDAVFGESTQKSRLNNVVMQLRKAANHPYLFPGVEDESLPPLGEHLVEMSGKMVILDKLLKKLKAQGNRVLIFSQMTQMLDILHDYCTFRGFSCCRIDGSVHTTEREAAMAEFNREGSEKFIFLLSTRAGGLGINLATADTVIFYDNDWNPQADLQAQDRAHRLGQKKKVHVYKLVTQHTVEERIIARAESKLRLDAMVIQQGRTVTNKSLSANEMVNMIRAGADKLMDLTDDSNLDDDIDLILERGEAATEELNKRMVKYDGFKLSLEETHNKLKEEMDQLTTIDDETLRLLSEEAAKRAAEEDEESGRNRERDVVNYGDAGRNATFLSKPSRVPKINEYHLLDVDRINALCDQELSFYMKWLRAATHPPSRSGLTEEEVLERRLLLQKGFSTWSMYEGRACIRALERFGRQWTRVQEDVVTKTIDEIKEWVAVWVEHPDRIKDGSRSYKTMLATEENNKQASVTYKRAGEMFARCTGLETAKRVKYNQRSNHKNRGFEAEDDVGLLYHIQHIPVNDGKTLRERVFEDEDNKFNFFMLSRQSNDLVRRVEMISKVFEKK